MISLYEILTTNKWMINPESIPAFRSIIEMNLRERLAVDPVARLYAQSLSQDGTPYNYFLNEDDDRTIDGNTPDAFEDEPFIDMIYVTGPIMRHDGPCGEPGSMTIRDHMLDKCRKPKCLGHIFYIDTPGGSAAAKADFESAIQLARSLGQPVIAFVDGVCASAGMYLASMCDERYYMHPDNQIGCIGVMAAFYTEKNGSFNQYTNETYREVYDPESFDKNGEIRALANDDDEAPLQAELAALGRQFRDDVLRACPKATDEHLHGRMFRAADVTGILMDGQSTIDGVVKRIMFLSQQSSATVPASSSSATSSTSDPSSSPAVQCCESGTHSPSTQQSPIINNMQYPNINLALGMTEGLELQVTEDGATLHTDLLSLLEQRLVSLQETVDAANQQLSEIGKQHDDDQALIQSLRDQLSTEQSASVEAEAQFTELRNQLAESNRQAAEAAQASAEQIQQLTDQLSAANQQLEEANNQLSDAQQQVATLTAEPQQEQQEAPATNGQGASAPSLRCGIPQFDPSLSLSENRRRLNEYFAKIERNAFSK